jgi:hypothetical protein
MRRLLTITITIAASALLSLPAPVLAAGCEREPEMFKLKIKVRDNKPIEVTHRGQNAEDLVVCPNDQVEWMLINPASAESFFVNFASGAPFGGGAQKSSNNGKIVVTIGGSAAQPGAVFKYDIGVTGGGVWDPRIIIDE